jgi:hypothetical protein
MYRNRLSRLRSMTQTHLVRYQEAHQPHCRYRFVFQMWLSDALPLDWVRPADKSVVSWDKRRMIRGKTHTSTVIFLSITPTPVAKVVIPCAASGSCTICFCAFGTGDSAVTLSHRSCSAIAEGACVKGWGAGGKSRPLRQVGHQLGPEDEQMNVKDIHRPSYHYL